MDWWEFGNIDLVKYSAFTVYKAFYSDVDGLTKL